MPGSSLGGHGSLPPNATAAPGTVSAGVSPVILLPVSHCPFTAHSIPFAAPSLFQPRLFTAHSLQVSFIIRYPFLFISVSCLCPFNRPSLSLQSAFDGALDEIAIYSAALSNGTIWAHFMTATVSHSPYTFEPVTAPGPPPAPAAGELF